MDTMALIAVCVLLAAVILLQILALKRKATVDPSAMEAGIASVEKSYERLERAVREELARSRDDAATAAKLAREETAAGAAALRAEVMGSLKVFGELVTGSMGTIAGKQREQLEAFAGRLDAGIAGTDAKLAAIRETVDAKMNAVREDSEKRLEGLKATVEERLRLMQTENMKQLELMRATVDEKLQSTLEKRLSESFKVVSERLEQVHKGLGEMQTLATGVGDLKRVLTNVKARGTWGEVQLESILSDVLAPEQYAKNVSLKDSAERVEFAVKFPNPGEDEALWLPIDAKFPMEDYQRLVTAQEKADAPAMEEAARQLEAQIKKCAGDIHDKYINPPRTTRFGIMFLPTEGLFAEVVRRGGLTEYAQRECNVTIAGPTTLVCILNGLRMGFQTLAIQKKSNEVWRVLGEVKTQFELYADVMAQVKKKLESAADTVDKVGARTRQIQKKLKDVEALPAGEVKELALEEGEEAGREHLKRAIAAPGANSS